MRANVPQHGPTTISGHLPAVLVCDDEPEIRDTVGAYLGSLGYEIMTARDGKECLEKIEKQIPDALVIDLKMPRVDGVTVVQELRRRGLDLPILVISALHDVGATLEENGLGMGIFVPKPFNLKEIAALLRAALLEKSDVTGKPVVLPEIAKNQA